MRTWFDGLTQREQLSLLLLGVALALYLVYTLLVAPLDAARDELVRQNHRVAESLQRVDVMVSQIMALRESGAGAAGKRNLTTLVNRSTADLNLQVARLQPNNRGEIQVRFEGAGFDDLLSWLHRMEMRESLLVRELSITQGASPGSVNVTVRLAQAG